MAFDGGNLPYVAPSDARFHYFVIVGRYVMDGGSETDYINAYTDEYVSEDEFRSSLNDGWELLTFEVNTVLNREQRLYASEMHDHALASLLWSETDDDGNPLDNTYDETDIDQESSDRVFDACVSFVEQFWDEIGEDGLSAGNAGHDFVMSANGHGVGFWDSDLKNKDLFHRDAKGYLFETYVGDDGRVYIS